MSFLSAVKDRFRGTASADAVETAPAAAETAAVTTETKTEGNIQAAAPASEIQQVAHESHVDETDPEKQAPVVSVGMGATTMEAAQAIWGKKGRWLLIGGLAMIMMIYEIDNSTVYVYNNYSTSSFNALSELAALQTANTILYAIVKPPLAKLTNVIGRGQTYLITISFYLLAYILMASATSINTYAAGYIFYAIGQSGTNLMNDIVISDVTSARWRAFGIGVSFFPFLFTPWIAGFIVDSVVAPNGIGWRWGIGMLGFLMPFSASFIITTLLYYQTKAKKAGLVPRVQMTVRQFLEEIDIIGVFLFSGGLAMVLVPLTLAATTPSQWSTPYLDALIAVGVFLLICLPFYEKYVATRPVVPVHYFTNVTVVCCLTLIALDSLGFSATHTYLYTWATVAKGLEARDATFFLYTNGVIQCLTGILAGLVMWWLRRYKWIAVTGATIRLIGYGVMLRLRGAENSLAEIFIVQVIQGIGSGIVQTVLLVPAQISLPHSDLALITALIVCFSFVGGSIGSCIAGGIYTNTIQPSLWQYLGSNATAETVNMLANSITTITPDWGTPDRTAISFAFSQVMQYMTYAALGSAAVGWVIPFFMPNLELPDRNNLVEE